MPVTLEPKPNVQFMEQTAPPVQDPLMRMHEELKRALEKKPEDRRWVMVIDLRKCVGCSACTVGCIAENKLPPGVMYRPVLDEEFGTYPSVIRTYLPKPCMQCDAPPCVPVCPVDATDKNAEGVVVIDYEKCIGCGLCVPACPYGARSLDKGLMYTMDTPVTTTGILGQQSAEVYERTPMFEYGNETPRQDEKSPISKARKCQFCLHRLGVGELPACTSTCIGRATYFGDANDPKSLVSELLAQSNVTRLKEDLGTKPRVYYLH